MQMFLLASHNKKKLSELSRILEPLGFTVISPKDIEDGISEPEENGASFEENALIKARSGAKETGLPTVADDSGLCVDALDGAPGIYSARYAGTGNDEDNNKLLLKNLENVPEDRRTARFVSCIACVFPDGREFTVRGTVEGKIGYQPQGNGGFGYDPLFISDKGCFGLLSAEEKDSISHRHNAILKFVEELKNYI